MTKFEVTYSQSDINSVDMDAESIYEVKKDFRKKHPNMHIIDIKPYKNYRVTFEDRITYSTVVSTTSPDRAKILCELCAMDSNYFKEEGRNYEVCEIEEDTEESK